MQRFAQSIPEGRISFGTGEGSGTNDEGTTGITFAIFGFFPGFECGTASFEWLLLCGGGLRVVRPCFCVALP